MTILQGSQNFEAKPLAPPINVNPGAGHSYKQYSNTGKTCLVEIFCRAHTRTSLNRNMWRNFRVFPTFSTISPCLAK